MKAPIPWMALLAALFCHLELILAQVCEDRSSECANYPQYCTAANTNMLTYCPLTCQQCTPSQTTTAGSSASGPCDPNTIADEIVAQRTADANLLTTQGASALAEAMFTSDGVIMTPDQDTYTGLTEVTQYFTNAVPTSASQLQGFASFLSSRATTVVCLSDDYAVSYGPYSYTAPLIRVINLWRREAGVWKIFLNMDTGDLGAVATVAP